MKLTLYDRGSRCGKVLWRGCGIVVSLSGRDAVLGGEYIIESSSEDEQQDDASSNGGASLPMSPLFEQGRRLSGIMRCE